MKVFCIYQILFLVLLGSAYSCSNDHNLTSFHKAINYINDSSLYSHFPDESRINKVDVCMPCSKGGGLEIVVFLNFEDDNQEDLVNKNTFQGVYSIHDSCANYFTRSLDSLKFARKDCIRNNSPIPDFRFWNSPSETMFTLSEVQRDLTYYVIESGPGTYLPDSLLTMNQVPLYKNDSHGFSRGVAVSRGSALFVYWLVIW